MRIKNTGSRFLFQKNKIAEQERNMVAEASRSGNHNISFLELNDRKVK